MKVGFIGLGRMGEGLVLNAIEKGHSPVVYNRTYSKTEEFAKNTGCDYCSSIRELKGKLPTPRVIWIMVTAGEATEEVISDLSEILEAGDIVIDGGNSFYKDSIRRAKMLSDLGINFLDIGTSGGIYGARNGACFMVGGNNDSYLYVKPFLESISVPGGLKYMGQSGAGHFTKMVHNGIEYGMMQSIAEGFSLMKKSGLDIELAKAASVYSHGSVIRGWLMELMHDELEKDPSLEKVPSAIGQSGEGLWTLQTALEKGVPTPAIASSVYARFDSNEDGNFSAKAVQALRQAFGRHDSSTRLK